MSAFFPAPSGRPGACAGPACRQRRSLARMRIVDRIAIIGLSLSLALVGCTPNEAQQHDETVPTTNASTASGRVTSAPLETAIAAQTLPVYWLGHSNDDVFLYREFFPAQPTDDPLVTALRTMMGSKPHDPDYFSLWNNPSRLGASISAKNIITIDISADAFAKKADQGMAERSVSQLIYTATAAAAMAGLVDTDSSIQVSVLVDGHTGYRAFGQVLLDRPLTRKAKFLAPVWIIDPADGATHKSLPLKVSGQGVSPTGALLWSLDRFSDGKIGEQYLNGTVSIPAGAKELGEFSFNIAPPPGSYQLSVYIADPSLPGQKIGIDSKRVSIVEPSPK